MERFRMAAGFQGQLVPFRGAPEAITEILGGRRDMYFCPITPAMPFIESGKLLPLAVSRAKRATRLPNVPTTVEAGYPDSDFEFYIGLTVPKKTPRDLVAAIHRATVKGLEDPSVKDKFAKLGVEPLTMTPEAYDARIAKEVPIAVKLANAAGIGLKK